MTPQELAQQRAITLEQWLRREYLQISTNLACGLTMFLASVLIVLFF